jgi:hypothetical protein
MGQTLLALALKAFNQAPSSAESIVLQAAEAGDKAVSHSAPLLEIPARIIEWVCTDKEAQPHIHRHGLALNGFKIVGILDLIHADIQFPLQFLGCEFTEQIRFKSARLRSLTFRSCLLRGLNADSAQIETNFLMVNNSESAGEVSLRGADIHGDFRIDGVKLSGDGSSALTCDRINVFGGVFLSQANAKSTFDGEVRFAGANIGGNFDCTNATFRNPSKIALCVERITTGGSIFLRGSQADGQIVVKASKIGVALDCRGANFTSGEGRTLDAEKAIIGSHVLLDGQFSCNYVHFWATTIQGGLRCWVAKIGKLDLRHARVEGLFEWADMIDPSASSIDFRDARLESIKDDEASWPQAGIQFDGLRFERFSVSEIGVDCRLKWLKLDSSGPAQAYRELSNVYDRGGRSDLAGQVLFACEELTRARRHGVVIKVWNYLLRWTIGYGYKLWRAAVIMTIVTVIGFGVAWLGFHAKIVAPSDRDANKVFVATGEAPSYYPRFSASMFSIEHSLPGVNLGIASSWSVNTSAQWPKHRGVGIFIRWWFWIQTLAGWVLSIFFVAGLSGVVKRPG